MRKVDRKSVGYETEGSTADPLLIFIAVTLLAVFAILELDRRGLTMGALCPIVANEVIVPCLVGP
jgi:hypothetical protein